MRRVRHRPREITTSHMCFLENKETFPGGGKTVEDSGGGKNRIFQRVIGRRRADCIRHYLQGAVH